ncbi:multiple sugar transport system permease protein [Cryobacterium flavum]|uniref:Carbohydrate ABC transporter permease n=1 Tax=Cryobacterium flavum TaxID=1424659 RepID=A0A4R8V465_9MICO|nr:MULTISPECIES: carbohydrate ABC transporter permease [Cryobacterium]TFB77168.1 carbohydrate ABC transporter permease [Cryobacterium flavum]TFD08574.1 carbohydrate ABC transporter permease [Cryobacterium sp. TMT1-66-1]SDN37297.1 multiple sugar transport system permease protein [Cryobacterium flavum]
MIGRRNLSIGVRSLLALVLVILAGFPVFWMINTAMTPVGDLYSNNQRIIPDFSRTLNIFQVLVSDSPFLRWLGNSALVAGGTTLLSLLLACLAAYALSRYKFVGKGLMTFGFFATQMLPEALLIVPLYSMFMTLGLLNELYGLVLVNTAFAMPVAVFLLKSAMDTVPYEIEESARVDGCNALTILQVMFIPLIAPSLAAAAVITFFDGWNEYLFATTFIHDTANWVASTGLASFIGEFTTPLDMVFSGAIVFTIPAAIFFLLMQRKIVAGLTAGSVKG